MGERGGEDIFWQITDVKGERFLALLPDPNVHPQLVEAVAANPAC